MARSAADGRRTRVTGGTPQAGSRPIVRGFAGGGRSFTLEFDTRTAYDFLVSMAIGHGEDSDLLPEDAAWLRRSCDSIGPEHLEALQACFAEEQKSVFRGVSSIIVASPAIRTAQEFVSGLEAAGWRGIARAVIVDNARGPIPDGLVDKVLDREADAIPELVPLLEDWTVEQVERMVESGPANYDGLLRAAAAWLPLFQEVEERVRRYQARDLASRAHDRATLDSATLIEGVTGGLRWLPEARIRRVIVAPSYFSRPYNYIYQGADWRVICYPIADAVIESTDSATPPASMVRLYRALGDPTRMRILKLLSDRDWYLTELATQLELSKPTMKHHLALLRAAGLVTVIEEGSLTYYNLRRQRLDEAGVELHRFIG